MGETILVWNRSVATIVHIFTLVHYEMTGVIINARCISRLESAEGRGGKFST